MSVCSNTYLEAVPYEVLNANTKILNPSHMDFMLHIHVPDQFMREHALLQIDELCYSEPDSVKGRKDSRLIDTELVQHELGRPWFDIAFDSLRQEVGLHIYRMSFVNTVTEDTVALYFGYKIQDDNPDKPYNYMRGGVVPCAPCNRV